MYTARYHFQEKLGNDTAHPVAAARLFNPVKVKEMQPTAAEVNALNAFPFLSGELHHLKEELSAYLVRVTDVAHSTSAKALEWWKDNSNELPYWSAAAHKFFLIQPSSATAERVFSILNRSFSDFQNNSLEDYVEASVMLQYNDRKS